MERILDLINVAIAVFGAGMLMTCGVICWHLLTDEDDCQHGNIGQHDGECQDCGERIEIGGSE